MRHQKEKEIHQLKEGAGYTRKPGVSKAAFYSLLLITACLAMLAGYSLFSDRKQTDRKTEQTDTAAMAAKDARPAPRTVIGQYKVLADRAYFHNEPDEATRRGAYMIQSNDIINALDDKNGFIYTEFTNRNGQTSKGWLKKEDLITLDEWNKKNNETAPANTLSQEEIASRLQQAKEYLDRNEVSEAVAIYKTLSNMNVPEAMFNYADLALRNKHNEIDCQAALDLLKQASDQNYVQAKRTLGFLYLFGENKEIIRVSNYDRCEYQKDVVTGTKLLMEAVLSGDTTARRILNLHQSRNNQAEEPDSGL